MKEFKMYFKIIALAICTIISSYGVLAAPVSTQSKLETELMHNEQLIKNQTASEPARRQVQNVMQKNSNVQNEGSDMRSTQLVSVIGDSVFLGAAPDFLKLHKNTVIDCKISRQVRQAYDVARNLNKKGKLGDIVIIALGTNGPFSMETGRELIDYLGAGRTIYWINVYGKNLSVQKDVNKTIRKLAEKNSNVHIIKWSQKGKKHPGWFYQDGIHLNPKGQKKFAKFIYNNISSPNP